MKKVISAVVSVCMLIGMAIPAFAEYSGQSGADEDIKIMEFAKSSYSVKNGETVNLSADVTAYASTKQLVQSPSIEWSLENDSNFAFSLASDGTLIANEDSGSANVIAKANNGKVTARVKVTAVRASTGSATSFTFEKSTYTLFTGSDATLLEENQTIDIIPSPKGTTFTSSQISEIESDASSAVSSGKFDIKGASVTVRPIVASNSEKVSIVYENGSSSNVTEKRYQYGITGSTSRSVTASIGGERISIPDGYSSTQAAQHIANNFSSSKWDITFDSGNSFSLRPGIGYRNADPGNLTLSGSGLTASTRKSYPSTVSGNVLGGIGDTVVAAKTFELEVSSFPSASNSTNASRVRKTVSVGAKPAVAAADINAPTSTITVKVGEKVSMESKFRLSPSSSNVASSWQYGRDYVNTNAQSDDFAVFTDNIDDPSEIIGVAVGKNKISASITGAAGETKTAYITVNVVEKGASTSSGNTSSTPDTSTDPNAPALTFTEGNTSVGGTGFTVSVKNVPEGTTVTYTSLDTDIAKVDNNGKVTPVSAGQTKIEIAIDGVADYLYCVVNVKSASTATPPGGTSVPQTGVTVLRMLF